MKLFKSLIQIIQKASPDLKRSFILVFIFLLLFNGLIWTFAIISALKYPLLLGLVTLAYGLGLRHAVDADHIAAIDNTIRKLMQDGKKPVGVGLFFSLGHSTVVILLSILVAFSASFVKQNLPFFAETGFLIGTSVSSFFLLSIGVINLLTLIELIRTWKMVIRGKKYSSSQIQDLLQGNGIMTRILRPLLKTIRNSQSMYVVGFLFGLGFDTATEVGLLSISAASGVSGMPFWEILLLPLAFTAGMTLIDTLDGILMLGAYGWAYIKPIRKLYYNMNITLISVIIAIFIGAIEVMQIFIEKLKLTGSIFDYISDLDFGHLGFVIIGAFILSWIISAIIYKKKGYDLLDVIK